jgi:hypothetical protein
MLPLQATEGSLALFHSYSGVRHLLGALACERSTEWVAHAKELSDFVFEQLHTDPGVVKVLSELRRLGHASLPRFVETISANPPKEMRTVYQWKQALWMTGSRFSDLGSLYASDDPLVVMVAFEATPNEEMEGAIAAKALARFESVYPKITEAQTRQRADMHMQMLRARLNPTR